MTERDDRIERRSTADLRHGDPEGVIVTPENAASAMVQADEAVMFRDGWG
jgi:hypothetical protein